VKVVKRRGSWVLDWYDFGKRKVKVFSTRRDAEDYAGDLKRQQRQRVRPTVDAHVTVREYAALFLGQKATALDLKPKTKERVRSALDGHILPALGSRKVRELDRPTVRAFLEGKLAQDASLQGQRRAHKVGRRKLARGSVLHLLHTLSALMREAVEDQLLVSNPLRGLGRALQLGRRRRGQGTEAKALTQAQLAAFLSTARTTAPDIFPVFAVMGLAGLRVGEAIALKWECLDLDGRQLTVREQLGGTTKTGETRTVEMAGPLVTVLRELRIHRREEALRTGTTVSPYALFPEFSESADAKAEQRVVKLIRRRMTRVLERAGLPPHHTPHSLRHSFASILLAKGTPIVAVQRALGHASITLTVDVYGSHLPVEAPGAVYVLAEGLDFAAPVTNGHQPVTSEEAACPQVLAATGTSSPRPAPCPRSPCTCT
jgi:integrase